MANDDFLFLLARIVFFVMAFVVIWHSLAPEDYRVLTELGKKIWAIAGLCLYVVILLEKRRRNTDPD